VGTHPRKARRGVALQRFGCGPDLHPRRLPQRQVELVADTEFTPNHDAPPSPSRLLFVGRPLDPFGACQIRAVGIASLRGDSARTLSTCFSHKLHVLTCFRALC
jgi:hypothetical protein